MGVGHIIAGGGKNHAAEIGAGAQVGKNAVENNLVFLVVTAAIGIGEAVEIMIGTAAVGATTAVVIKAADSIDTVPSSVPEEKSVGTLEMSRPEEEKVTSTAGPRPEVEPTIGLPGGHKDEVIDKLINVGHPEEVKITSHPQYDPEPIKNGAFTTPVIQPSIENVGLFSKSDIPASIQLTPEGVDHLKERHVGNNDGWSHKSKWTLNNADWKSAARDTYRNPDRVSYDEYYNRYTFEKEYKRQVGISLAGESLEKLRVVTEENGDLVTSFPKRSLNKWHLI